MKKFFLVLLFLSIGMFAEEVDEKVLFFDTNIIASAPTLITNLSQQKSLTLSGEFRSQLNYAFTKDFLNCKTQSNTNPFSYGIDGDFFFNIRPQSGYRIYGDLWLFASATGIPVEHTFFDPLTQTPLFAIETNTLLLKNKELFLDMNIANTVYLRMGKQVLKWGTTYFWNPIDLLNRERKTFSDPNSTREGIWGLKIHIPWRSSLNWYSFVDITECKQIENSALASRIEWVIGNTEIGISGWWKKSFVSVYGGDVSTRLIGFDIKAESSFSYGDNRSLLKEDLVSYGMITFTNYSLITPTNQWVIRSAINLSRSFDFLDVKDRITTMIEIFYNSTGKDATSLFDNPSKISQAIFHGSYIPNEYNTWYAFGTLLFKRFLFTDTSLLSSFLWNIEDSSALLSLQFTYSPDSTLTASISATTSVGLSEKEYTYDKLPLKLTSTIILRF